MADRRSEAQAGHLARQFAADWDERVGLHRGRYCIAWPRPLRPSDQLAPMR
jgi:hypothetical protein